MPPTESARAPRVEFLANSLVVGGAERVVERLLLHLPAHGLQTGLATLREPGPVGEALRERGVRVREELAPRRLDPLQPLAVRRHLRAVGADLVFVLDHSNALLYGRLGAALAGLPQVMAVHRTRRADGSASLGRADRLLMPLSQRVIAVSEGHRRYLVEEEGLPPERLTVIHNGIDPDRFRPSESPAQRRAVREELGLPVEATVAAVVAALRPEKNHELLLEAAATPSLRELHLAFVGEGRREPALRATARERGLDERVHWLGVRDDVDRLLPALDILVLPSHPKVETFPLCVLEAMGAGLPVVATQVGSLDEMVVDGSTGRLVSPGDAEALSGALRELLGDEALRRRWGRAGRARVVERFDSETMVRRTAELLHGLL